MHSVPTFKCPYCAKETQAQIDFSGDTPTGMLSMCDCPEFRVAWEADHRAKIERQKVARRNATTSRSIVHVGRTPNVTGRVRQRSR